VSEGTYITPTVRLVRQLGQGGMGSVWVADHLALRTQVVVKFMAERLASDAVSVARFTREAAAAAQIKSPHVVQVFDHGVTPQGIPFIVMELLEGNDLGHHLKQRNGFLSPQELASILWQVAKALGKAHERGIVHRDIKPENIFLCDGGSGETFVKLLDFGIAKGGEVLSNATSTGAVMGTPYYMSPEQMVGAKNVDFRSDLWSLGVVAYQALTGTRPFDGDTYGALAIAIHSAPLVPPTKINPNLPPSLDAWFAKACARDPNERFGSAKELAESFAAAVSGKAPSAEGTGPWGQLTTASTGGFPAMPPPDGNGPMGQTGANAAGTTSPLTSSTDPNQASQSGLAPVPKKGSGMLVAIIAIGLVVAGGLVAGGLVFFNNSGTSSKKDEKSSAQKADKDDKDDKDEKDDKDKGDKDKGDKDKDPSDKAKPTASEDPAATKSATPPDPSVPPTPSTTTKPTSTWTPPTVVTTKPTTTTTVPTTKPTTTPTTKPTTKPTSGKYDDDIK
jgi:serine/threonine protein kinase